MALFDCLSLFLALTWNFCASRHICSNTVCLGINSTILFCEDSCHKFYLLTYLLQLGHTRFGGGAEAWLWDSTLYESLLWDSLMVFIFVPLWWCVFKPHWIIPIFVSNPGILVWDKIIGLRRIRLRSYGLLFCGWVLGYGVVGFLAGDEFRGQILTYSIWLLMVLWVFAHIQTPNTPCGCLIVGVTNTQHIVSLSD